MKAVMMPRVWLREIQDFLTDVNLDQERRSREPLTVSDLIELAADTCLMIPAGDVLVKLGAEHAVRAVAGLAPVFAARRRRRFMNLGGNDGTTQIVCQSESSLPKMRISA